MRHTFIIHALLGALVLSVQPTNAQDYNLPPGKWWENDRMVAHLEISADQQAKIRDLVYSHATRMIDLNASLEKAKLTLANQVGQQVFQPKEIRTFFAVFQEARRLLELERFEMLLSVRQVLTHEQWEKMLSLRERLDGIRQRRDGPGEPRPIPGRMPPRNSTPGQGGPRR